MSNKPVDKFEALHLAYEMAGIQTTDKPNTGVVITDIDNKKVFITKSNGKVETYILDDKKERSKKSASAIIRGRTVRRPFMKLLCKRSKEDSNMKLKTSW